MNKLTIIGCLGKDPDTRTTQGGKTVCSFSVAVSSKRNGEEVTTWFRVNAWDKLGENCQRYLLKGRKVAVVGPVSVSTYEAKDGSGTRFTLEVRADDVEFLSPREQSDAAEPHAPASKPAQSGALAEDDPDFLPF